MKKNSEKNRCILICVLLAAVTVAVYWPIKNHEFINYDDNEYVTDNAAVRAGLSCACVRWAFTSTVSSHWHPVTWLSHMLDCQLFGLNPAGHHLMNLLLHVINTLLLFLIFKATSKDSTSKLKTCIFNPLPDGRGSEKTIFRGCLNNVTGLTWQSAFIAALFALHPFHVESVAWAAERKDTLSMLFWLLTMAAYFRYAARGKIGFYILSLVFFAIGLMSKPMVVTLPAILLLMDFWPLKRIGFDSLIPPKIFRESSPFTKITVEKIPFFLLAGISSVITVIIMKQGGLVAPVEGITVWSRLANALTAYAAYIIKTFWPSGLALFYPHPGNSLPLWKPIISLIFLIAITIAFIHFGVRRRYLIVGWLWYLITLLPVIGLLQVGGQAMADRYTYVPLTGIFIMLSYGFGELAAGWKYRRPVISIAAVAALTALIIVSRIQLSYWQNGITIFGHSVKITKNNSVAYNNLGIAYSERGRYLEAAECCGQAVRINPNYAEAYTNLGFAYGQLGRYEEAIESHRQAIRINPRYAEAYNNLGFVYGTLGDYQVALESCGEAVKIKPDYAEAYYNLGIISGKLGRYDDEIECYKRATQLKPHYAGAHYNLGNVYLMLGRYQEAAEYYVCAVKIKPDYAEAYNNLGNAYFGLERYKESMESYRQAIRIKPDFAEARCNLGIVCLMTGNKDAAMKEYEILKNLDAAQADKLFKLICGG